MVNVEAEAQADIAESFDIDAVPSYVVRRVSRLLLLPHPHRLGRGTPSRASRGRRAGAHADRRGAHRRRRAPDAGRTRRAPPAPDDDADVLFMKGTPVASRRGLSSQLQARRSRLNHALNACYLPAPDGSALNCLRAALLPVLSDTHSSSWDTLSQVRGCEIDSSETQSMVRRRFSSPSEPPAATYAATCRRSGSALVHRELNTYGAPLNRGFVPPPRAHASLRT
ncbi:hypothetical protein FB451DRAFT_1385815 [Mycena latifolia]|nr:hypothetical protein FB451DRAFT_1385815 [Mycena latifolia]